MIIDFLSINYTNIYLSTILLYIFILNKKYYIYILLLDIIINTIPFISIIIYLLYLLNKEIFKILNNNFINRFILINIYYFIYGISLYSIYNKFNISIITYLFNNIIYNLIYYYIGLKII